MLMLQNIPLRKSVRITKTFRDEQLKKLLEKNLCVPIAVPDPTYFARRFSQASLSLPFDTGNYLLPIPADLTFLTHLQLPCKDNRSFHSH